MQVLVEQQEDWCQKRSNSQVLRTRTNRKIKTILTRNQSMMADPNYTVLYDDSSSVEDAEENTLVKVKESPTATGNKITSQLLLLICIM